MTSYIAHVALCAAHRECEEPFNTLFAHMQLKMYVYSKYMSILVRDERQFMEPEVHVEKFVQLVFGMLW